MGLLPLSYGRPAHVSKHVALDSQISLHPMGDEASNEKSGESLRSGKSGHSSGIPAALTFDRIVDGGTCPPCTIRDFMNYLIYVERAAENLQFFLWYRDYVQRFREASTSDLVLSPEWTQAMEDDAVARIQKELAETLRQGPPDGPAADIFRGTDFENRRGLVPPQEPRDPFSTPPQSSGNTDEDGSLYASSHAISNRTHVSEAFVAAGTKVPFTIQPFRAEISRIISIYIADGAPRQLNLSSREQRAVMHALAHTTHPSALRAVARSVEATLRQQAHPNFIRWSICNGNPPRVAFARALGSGLVALSLTAAVVLTLSRAGRGWRALAAVGWVLGVATLVAAAKGMCVVLHGLHHRHVRPWELFETGDGDDAFGLEAREKRSFDSLGSSNSYEDEPWVVRYRRRNLVRKVFDREIWVQEPALRQIQDTIFVQSLLCAVVAAALLTILFVAVPAGNFF